MGVVRTGRSIRAGGLRAMGSGRWSGDGGVRCIAVALT